MTCWERPGSCLEAVWKLPRSRQESATLTCSSPIVLNAAEAIRDAGGSSPQLPATCSSPPPPPRALLPPAAPEVAENGAVPCESACCSWWRHSWSSCIACSGSEPSDSRYMAWWSMARASAVSAGLSSALLVPPLRPATIPLLICSCGVVWRGGEAGQALGGFACLLVACTHARMHTCVLSALHACTVCEPMHASRCSLQSPDERCMALPARCVCFNEVALSAGVAQCKWFERSGVSWGPVVVGGGRGTGRRRKHYTSAYTMRLSPIVTNRKKIPQHGFESQKTGASPVSLPTRQTHEKESPN
jgi:hypothetical protein